MPSDAALVSQPVALLALVLSVVAGARLLEQRLAWVRAISSAVVCTVLGILLANAGVIPQTSPVYDGVNAYAVPYAIVLVILGSDLRDLGRAGRPMVAAFALAAAGSFAGSLVMTLAFAGIVGAEAWKLGGQFAASFTGGGMNFVAVGRALGTSADTFAAASVVNSLSTVPWMLAQVGLYRVLVRFYQPLPAAMPATTAEDMQAIRDRWDRANLTITDLAVLGALPLAVLWGSERLAPLLPGFPLVLWQTTIALLLAQVPAVRRLEGAPMLSYFALHLFFVVIGTSALFSALAGQGPLLAAYMASILAVHGAVVYGAGALARLDLASLTIASQAAVGGPGSALALAMTMRWPALVTPGIILGIFGYAVGNYAGVACAYLARALVTR